MIAQVQAFADDVADLARALTDIAPRDWSRVTQFKGWTIEEVVLHLYASDYSALLSIASPAEFAALRADIQRLRRGGLSMIEESGLRFAEPRGTDLLAAWAEQAEKLAALLGALGPHNRLEWFGPSMSVKSFATARQMETWAHGQEVYDVLGLVRAEHDRIENIAFLGVRTFSWSFKNRGWAVPDVVPHLKLILPSGRSWTAGTPSEDQRISGSAAHFCQVVTQVRNIADTDLEVAGEIADQWMAIAQCFAGPPSDPPAPGVRHRIYTAATVSVAVE